MKFIRNTKRSSCPELKKNKHSLSVLHEEFEVTSHRTKERKSRPLTVLLISTKFCMEDVALESITVGGVLKITTVTKKSSLCKDHDFHSTMIFFVNYQH